MTANRIALLLLLSVCAGCSPSEVGLIPLWCVRLGHGAIKNDTQAILLARKTWYCIHPRLQQMDESQWLKDFVAERRHGLWSVSVTLPKGYSGGGLNFDFDESDGHLVKIFQTQ
jgi:hypothetical protein